jgi:hypothetical protein
VKFVARDVHGYAWIRPKYQESIGRSRIILHYRINTDKAAKLGLEGQKLAVRVIS